MYATIAIIVLAGSGTGQLDWSSITLDPPVGMAPAGDQLDLSGIVLDPPVEPTTAGSPIDWSGITIEPPIDPATGGSQVDWSGVSLEAPVSTTTGGNPDWSSHTPAGLESTTTEQPGDNKTATTGTESTPNDSSTCGCSTTLLGVVLGAAVVGLLASCVQLWLLKRLLGRASSSTLKTVDLERGDR